MQGYRELKVWQRAMELVEYVYYLVGRLPKSETYALSDQMRRAVVSIPSNIAEGRGRDTDKDYAYFLVIARGSKFELETQILICERLKYINAEEARHALMLCDEVGKMLNSLICSLKAKG